MDKIIIIFMLLSAMPVMTGIGYCREMKQQGIRYISGNVSEVDWVAGKIVVRTFDFGAEDEMTFVVSDDTEIDKGSGEIPLADVNLSDKVTVEYNNSYAGLQAARITVME